MFCIYYTSVLQFCKGSLGGGTQGSVNSTAYGTADWGMSQQNFFAKKNKSSYLLSRIWDRWGGKAFDQAVFGLLAGEKKRGRFCKETVLVWYCPEKEDGGPAKTGA